MDSMDQIRNTQDKRRASAGFSLLEVLIALVILSVGLLGVAALISTALKSNGSAYMRTQATVLSYNILDRMRSNKPATDLGSYTTMPAAPSAATAGSPAISACSGTPCSSAALATYDIAQWEYDLAQQLPQGRGSITNPPVSVTTGVSSVVVTVLWNDSRAHDSLQKSGAPTAATFSLSVSSALP